VIETNTIETKKWVWAFAEIVILKLNFEKVKKVKINIVQSFGKNQFID
jgi:hypothetical protein